MGKLSLWQDLAPSPPLNWCLLRSAALGGQWPWIRQMGRGDFAIPDNLQNLLIWYFVNIITFIIIILLNEYTKMIEGTWEGEILLFLWSNQIPLYNFTRIIRTSRDVLLSDHKVWYIIGHFYNIFAHFCKWFLVTKRCFIERWSSLIYNWYDIFFRTFLHIFASDFWWPSVWARQKTVHKCKIPNAIHSFEIRIYHFIIVIDTHLMINHDSDFQK